MIRAWRIVKTKYIASEPSREGARLYPGRWNNRGVPVIYAADSLALAVLEIVVNFDADSVEEHYSVFSMQFESDMVLSPSPEDLPENWDKTPIVSASRLFGDQWVKENKKAVLKVPSVVIPQEYNFVLNPKHPDFNSIHFGAPQPLKIDDRLHRKK